MLSRTRLESQLDELASAFPDLLLKETPLLAPYTPDVASDGTTPNYLVSPPPAALGGPSGIAASPASACLGASGPPGAGSSSSCGLLAGHSQPADSHSHPAGASSDGVSLLSRAGGTTERRKTRHGGLGALRAAMPRDPASAAGGPLLRRLEAASSDTGGEGQQATDTRGEDPLKEAMRSSILGWEYAPLQPRPQGNGSGASGGGGGQELLAGSSGGVVKAAATSLADVMAEEERRVREQQGRAPRAPPSKAPNLEGPRPEGLAPLPILHFVKRSAPVKPDAAPEAAKPTAAWGGVATNSTATPPSPTGAAPPAAAAKPCALSLSDILKEETARGAGAATPAAKRATSGTPSKGAKAKPKYVPLAALAGAEVASVSSPAPKLAWGACASPLGGFTPRSAPSPSAGVGLTASFELSPPAKPLSQIFAEQASTRRDEPPAQSTKWGLLPESSSVSLAAIQKEERCRTTAEVEEAEVAAAIAAVEAAEHAAAAAAAAAAATASGGKGRRGAPAGGGPKPAPPPQPKPRPAVLCKHFAAGAKCRKGASCPYAHGPSEPPQGDGPERRASLARAQTQLHGSGQDGVDARRVASVPAPAERGAEVVVRVVRAGNEVWGVRLRGGAQAPPEVEAVSEGGLAHGLLKVGDAVLSINGASILGHDAAAAALKVAAGDVVLVLRRHVAAKPRQRSKPSNGAPTDSRRRGPAVAAVPAGGSEAAPVVAVAAM